MVTGRALAGALVNDGATKAEDRDKGKAASPDFKSQVRANQPINPSAPGSSKKMRKRSPGTAIAAEHGMTVDQVNAAFDQHPIETNKEPYFRRQLARALFTLDELEYIFRAKARAGDVAAGTLLVKTNERRSSLLGLNGPPGFSVNVVHGPPKHQEKLD